MGYLGMIMVGALNVGRIVIGAKGTCNKGD